MRRAVLGCLDQVPLLPAGLAIRWDSVRCDRISVVRILCEGMIP